MARCAMQCHRHTDEQDTLGPQSKEDCGRYDRIALTHLSLVRKDRAFRRDCRVEPLRSQRPAGVGFGQNLPGHDEF